VIDLFVDLLPFLAADVVNPVLFAFMVYAAGTRQPVWNSSAVLFGHTLAYFVSGLVLALGFDRITDYLANPGAADYLIGFVVGVLLLWVALGPGKNKERSQAETDGVLTPAKAFGWGGIINFVGVPFALPYFGALNQVMKANLTATESLVALVAYNLLYALPFLIVPLLVAMIGERSGPLLQRINGVLDRISGVLMPLLLGLAGLALVVDAVLFFSTGEGLF